MPGTHKKGTNDADSNGEKGGSLPEESAAAKEPAAKAPPKAAASAEERLDALEKETADLRKLMQRNGWSC